MNSGVEVAAAASRTRETVSLVVPFHNESEAVGPFWKAVRSVIDQMPGIDFEIVCVDDGSRDDTLVRLLALSAQDTRINVIELSRNFGKEAALSAGLAFARGDAVIPLDADLQDPPELIPAMIGKWREGADVVLARRIDRSADTFLKRKTAQLFYRFHNMLSSVRIPENVGDFRLLDRVAVDALAQLPERQRFMKGLFAWIGFRTVTLDYARPPRMAGNTSFSGRKLWNLAVEGITSFSAVPLKFWTYIGILGAVATFLYATFIVLRTLMFGVDVPGYASLIVAILLVGSFQLISIGILGEYISRIYMESKNRPLYIVRRRYGADIEPQGRFRGGDAGVSGRGERDGSTTAERPLQGPEGGSNP
jgi:polyisoprenyl-phosphate glycosyltransferase